MTALAGMKPRVLAAGGGGLVAVVLLWFLVLWSPNQQAYDKAHTDVTSSEASIQALQAQIAQLKSGASQKGSTQNAKQAVEAAAIPADPNLAQLIDQINDAATQSGVNFISITPSQPTATAGAAESGPPSIAVALNVSGGYYQIIDFINRLDTLPRLMVIQGINLTPGGTNTELTATLTTHVFTSRTVTTASTTTTTLPASGATTTTTAAAP